MAIPLRTGHEAIKANARLALREGETAFHTGLPKDACPYTMPLDRAAWRQGWETARGDWAQAMGQA